MFRFHNLLLCFIFIQTLYSSGKCEKINKVPDLPKNISSDESTNIIDDFIHNQNHTLPIFRTATTAQVLSTSPYHVTAYIIDGRDKSFFKPKKAFCEPVDFQHFYVISGNKTQIYLNKWRRTRIGHFGTLQDLCLKPNGLPLWRKCIYDRYNHTAEWEQLRWSNNVRCYKEVREPIISRKLSSLHEEVLSGKHQLKDKKGRREVTDQLCDLLETKDHKNLPADVHFAGNILKAINDESQDVELSSDILNICNIFASSDKNILLKSREVNATNVLLETFETYMDALTEDFVSQQRCGLINNFRNISNQSKSVDTIDLSHLGVYAEFSANISVFYVNPYCKNITGIALYDSNVTTLKESYKQSHTQFKYRFLKADEQISEIQSEYGLQLATFLPKELWQYIELAMKKINKNLIIVLKIYSTDALFVENTIERYRKPFGRVLSISIPGYDSSFPQMLPFLLRNENCSQQTLSNKNTGCGYWNYETWTTEGVLTKHLPTNDSNPIILCSTNHLTQFSYLIGGIYRDVENIGDDLLITPLHSKVLDIISLIGCTLSLLGLVGIWLTAALFSKWRALPSTKILLNLCFALTLQMILFLFVNTDDFSESLVNHRKYSGCVALGALLQYSLLVLFLWMLIAAVLQFQRYVTVIGIDRPKHYILKAGILAWCLPLIPTLLVVFIDPKSYIPNEYELMTDTGICYPSGYSLTFGVILPICIIIITNLSIFVYVFFSISQTLRQSTQRNERSIVMKQIRLSILLFFLFGLSWIFGIFAFMHISIVFSYLFCLTATLQGFVLFIYFVVMSDVARNEWLNIYCKSRQDKMKGKSKETQSMTITSTGVSNNNHNNA